MSRSHSFRIVALLLLAVFVLTSCQRDEDFTDYTYHIKLKSDCAFVYYPDTGETKYFGDENTKVYPASTTKLLTVLASLSILPQDELITPGDEVYSVEENSSQAYIRPNHTLTLEMLAEGMLIPSGNDAAYAVASACGHALLGDDDASYTEAVDAFVEYMNEYAISLGCTGTHFTKPDGYDGSEHYSTLLDMAIISSASAKNDIIRKYSALSSDKVTYASGHINSWTNTNKLLLEDSKYYNENVVGLKTGSLDDYYSLIAMYDDGELCFIAGVFGSESDDGRYKDVLGIIDGEKYVYYGK